MWRERGQDGERQAEERTTTEHNAPSAQRRHTSRLHTHTHLITFSQVVLSSVAINRLCGRALANSFIESLVVTRKNAHTRSHGSDALPDSNTQGELQGCQGDPFPCQTLILCQRYLSIRICSHLHPSQFLPVSLRFALFYLFYIFLHQYIFSFILVPYLYDL